MFGPTELSPSHIYSKNAYNSVGQGEYITKIFVNLNDHRNDERIEIILEQFVLL